MPAAAPLRARDLTVVRGPLTVLDGVDLIIASGQRIGVVGPNGVGKTTLLRALAGEITPDRGRVLRTPPTATVGYLPQEPSRAATETVRAYLARRTGVAAAHGDLDAATAALAAHRPGADDDYAAALDRWLGLGGADLDARVGQVWADLGLPARLLDESTASLSGGEAARASLAALLLARFDVFLLDEPTNDLDLDGLDRIERWVTGLDAAVVLVSHDRTFLARTVTHVVELDEFTHRASHFAGGWQGYLDEREAARRHAWERFEEYDERRRSLAQRSQREREWASQGLAKVRRRRRTNRTRTSAPSASTRPSSSPVGPPAPSGRSSGSRSSPSRGSRGGCSCRCRRPAAVAMSSPASRGPSSTAARSDSGRST